MVERALKLGAGGDRLFGGPAACAGRNEFRHAMARGIPAEGRKQCSSARIYVFETLAFARFQARVEIVSDFIFTAFVGQSACLKKGLQKQLQSPVDVLKDMLVAWATERKIASGCTGTEACAHVFKARNVI